MKQPRANRRAQMKVAAFRARVKMVALYAAAIVAVLSLGIARILALANESLPLPPVAIQASLADVAAVSPIHRFAFPYSVIPRGAYSATELRHALAGDTVAAEHHRGVVLDAVRAEIVAAPRLVYMSYRIGDEVAWTKHPVLLPAGETILTDGVSEIRARCGNGISEVPMEPTADGEPHAVEFDALGELVSYAPSGPAVPPLNGSALNAPPSGGPVLPGGQDPSADGSFTRAPGSPGGLTPWPQHTAAHGGSSPRRAGTALEQLAEDRGLVDFTGSPLPPGVLNDPPYSDWSNPGGNGPGTGGSDPGDKDPSDPKDDDDSEGDPDDPTDPGDDPDDDPVDPDDPGGGPEDPDYPDHVPSIPEPGTMLLFGTGAAAALLRRLRARRLGVSSSICSDTGGM